MSVAKQMREAYVAMGGDQRGALCAMGSKAYRLFQEEMEIVKAGLSGSQPTMEFGGGGTIRVTEDCFLEPTQIVMMPMRSIMESPGGAIGSSSGS